MADPEARLEQGETALDEVASILWVLPEVRGRGTRLTGARLSLGRGEECDVTLDSELVSRRHAELWREGRAWMVGNASSTNGVYVNGARVEQAKLSPGKSTGRRVEAAKTGERKVFFGTEHGTLTTQIFNRDRLEPGHRIVGPAIVEQLDTTTVIHPEQVATVDEYRNIIIRENK